MSGPTIDRPRALRAGVLAAWSGFFFWLWLSGEMTRYLGPRTYWVIVFGAIALGLAALAHLPSLRATASRPVDKADLVGAAVLLVPLIAVALVPDAQLGAQAASRKASAGGFAAASFLPAPDPDGEISFAEIHYASQSEEYAAEAGIAQGVEVSLTGFVAPPEGSTADFRLTRFYVSCCAADAIPYSVPVRGSAPDPEVDAWVHLRGVLVQAGDGFVVDATQIREVPPPDDPYLY